MRILLVLLGGVIAYETIAWFTRRPRPEMSDGMWWVQREGRKGDTQL